jgi:hypothetical protein
MRRPTVCRAATSCTASWPCTEQTVFSAIQGMRCQLPFALLGIDSDNGTEFIDDLLYRYCDYQKITFTRWEWLIGWANEVHHMSWIGWVALFVQLAVIETISKEAQGTFQRIRAARKATRFASQAYQVVT